MTREQQSKALDLAETVSILDAKDVTGELCKRFEKPGLTLSFFTATLFAWYHSRAKALQARDIYATIGDKRKAAAMHKVQLAYSEAIKEFLTVLKKFGDPAEVANVRYIERCLHTTFKYAKSHLKEAHDGFAVLLPEENELVKTVGQLQEAVEHASQVLSDSQK